MWTTPDTGHDTKRRIYAVTLALSVPMLLAWWAYSVLYDGNRFLALACPLLAALALLGILLVARFQPGDHHERSAFLLAYAFTAGTLISRLVWPVPPALVGMDEALLVFVSLAGYLLLPARLAILASASLFTLSLFVGGLLLRATGADLEAWLAVATRHGMNLAVIVLLYSVAWIRHSWAQERHTRRHEQRLAYLDPLTEILNRRGLYRALHDSSRAQALSVVLVDVDAFKSINDVHGHQTGDLVLREVAALLSAACREGDLVGRWGGEEFLLLLPRTSAEEAARVAERLRERLAGTRLLPDRHVTASFGVAERADAEDLEALLRRADQALYEAKRGGKNRVWTSLPDTPGAASATLPATS